MSTLSAFSLGKLSRTTPFPAISIPGTRLLSAFGPPVLVGMGYYLGTRIGFAWTPPGQPNSTFWPPNAILLACLLLAPRRRWWTFLLALLPVHMLAQLQTGVPISTAVGWFISNTAEAFLGAFCITRFVDPRKMFDSVRGVLTFIVFAVVVAPFATSFLDAFAVVITGWGRSYWPLGLERFSTNALAALTVVPTIVVFSRNGIFSSKRLTLAKLAELVVFAVATLLHRNLRIPFHFDRCPHVAVRSHSLFALGHGAIRGRWTQSDCLDDCPGFDMEYDARARAVPFRVHATEHPLAPDHA